MSIAGRDVRAPARAYGWLAVAVLVVCAAGPSIRADAQRPAVVCRGLGPRAGIEASCDRLLHAQKRFDVLYAGSRGPLRCYATIY
jgi:hypothetical protein